jgi:hypothetical protein
MPMNFDADPLWSKALIALVLWTSLSLLSIPLWEAAWLLPHCFWPPSALLELHRCPTGLMMGMILLVWMHAEDGVGSLVARYWPAIMIASAFSIWVLGRMWRRS